MSYDVYFFRPLPRDSPRRPFGPSFVALASWSGTKCSFSNKCSEQPQSVRQWVQLSGSQRFSNAINIYLYLIFGVIYFLYTYLYIPEDRLWKIIHMLYVLSANCFGWYICKLHYVFCGTDPNFTYHCNAAVY